MSKQSVKVVSIAYGVLGNPNDRRIEKAISKWIRKGYRLEKRDESPGSWASRGRTSLTFIRY